MILIWYSTQNVSTYLYVVYSCLSFLSYPLPVPFFSFSVLYITPSPFFTISALTPDGAVKEKGYEELLDKITEFIRKRGRGKDYDTHKITINREDIHIGIKFIYPFRGGQDEISVDLFLSPNFSDPDEFLTSLRQIEEKQRRM